MEDLGKGLAFLIEVQNLTRRPWLKVQLLLWPWEWKPCGKGSGAGRQTKPVSLDTTYLTFLKDYLLRFLSLQPNVGKKGNQTYGHSVSQTVTISQQIIKQCLHPSCDRGFLLSGLLSSLQAPVQVFPLLWSFLWLFRQISVHFSAFSINTIYTPLFFTLIASYCNYQNFLLLTGSSLSTEPLSFYLLILVLPAPRIEPGTQLVLNKWMLNEQRNEENHWTSRTGKLKEMRSKSTKSARLLFITPIFPLTEKKPWQIYNQNI